jgi:hypothetical protein
VGGAAAGTGLRGQGANKTAAQVAIRTDFTALLSGGPHGPPLSKPNIELRYHVVIVRQRPRAVKSSDSDAVDATWVNPTAAD